MIANIKELEVACRNLKAMQRALEILHGEIEAANPELFKITSKAYVRKIQALRCEIAEYLGAHPEAVSLLLNPDFAVVPLTATQEMEQTYLEHLHSGATL
jgi:hypothetical protein